jgi:hypothetical protein
MIIDVSEEEFEQLKRIFVHKSGHAVMAVLQGLPCSGIFLHSELDVGKFCCVATPHEPLTKGDYLEAAAGVAAELIVFEEFDVSRADSDRQVFEKPAAPPWDEMVEEARIILRAERQKLRFLASLVEDKVMNTPDGSMLKTQQLSGYTGVFRELVTGETVCHLLARHSRDC